MHAYLGHDARRQPPLILGHEACGTIIDGLLAGQRVVVNPLASCGHCDHCLGGRANLCLQRDLIGMYRPGAFAEQLTIGADQLLPVADGMPAEEAALTEPAATAVHAINRAKGASHRPLCEGEALVFGGGSVGLFAAYARREQGLQRIDVAETNPQRSTSSSGGCLAIWHGLRCVI